VTERAAAAAEAPLAARLPPAESVGADAILDRFVAWVIEDLGLELYPAQEEAILELLGERHVLLATPTGSGKSLVAWALHFKCLAEGRVSYYTSPVKALANEKFFELCDVFGPEKVGLLTGDAAVNRDAPIRCCTTEVLASIGLNDPDQPVDAVVLDEFHYYGDRDRGMAWHLPLVTLPRTQFLLMSATLGHTAQIEERLEAYTGRQVVAIHGTERPVPLEFEYRETPLHETVEALIEAKDAPIYLVNFTQRACPEQAQALTSINLTSKEEKKALSEAIADVAFDTPHGKDLARFLRHGIGLHHAGLLPRYRRLVERLAQKGLLKVISGTDTLGVGVNVPIRTVLFTRLCKFDGEKVGVLTARDFHQIAGRAGRRGFDTRGRVVAQAPEHVVENLKMDRKIAERPELKKKLVKKKPPDRGYAHWDAESFRTLVDKRPEPLEPRFEVGWSMLVDLQREAGAAGYRRLVEIIGRAHLDDRQRRAQRRLAAQRFRILRRAGVLQVSGRTVRVDPELQDDFSIRQAHGLWLLDAVARLDSEAETHPLDLLTLVESTLEDPVPILRRQQDEAFTARLAELKAEGLEYEERMEKLAGIEHPKPLREFVYGTFNAFAEAHPWVALENIRPKSVARDLVERCLGFSDYVRAYGLQRVEGLLLRYLTDAYKAAVQSVPDAFRTEAFEDVVTYLRQVVRHTDASLLEEWESLVSGEAAPRRPGAPEPPRPPLRIDPAADPRAFAARLRSELHRLLGALAVRDWSAAATLVRQDEEAWTDADFEAALAPFFEVHGMIELGPRARQPRNTVITENGARRWAVQQVIVDPAGEGDFAIHGLVDLSTLPEDPDAPLIAVVRIGA
jgi:hypothetical protein